MPTPEELQKRLERMVKLGMRLRITQQSYALYEGPNTLELMINAECEFDKVLRGENGAIIRQFQESRSLPF